MVYSLVLKAAADGAASPLDVLALEGCTTALRNLRESQLWVKTASPGDGEAVGGAAPDGS